MRIKLILAFVLMLTNWAWGQNVVEYWQYVNEADYWYVEKDFGKAVFLFKKAETLHPLNNRDAYILAKAYLAEGDKKLFFEYLKKAEQRKRKSTSIFYLKNDRDLKDLLTAEDWASVELVLDETHEHLGLSDSLSIVFEALYDKMAKKNKDSGSMLNKDSIFNQDFKEFMALIETHGYPSFSRAGSDIYDVMFSFFMPSDGAFLRILKKEFDAMRLYPFIYAYVIERFEYNKNRINPCLYNTLKNTPCEASDWAAVIKRRYEIGLSVFFEGYRERLIAPNTKMPWANNQSLISPYMHFKPKKKL
jgi:tetratricopeptide (TPR) repeat protein